MGVFWFLLLVGVGTAIFKVYEHMSLIDAFYLTVVSSSTVGYGARMMRNLPECTLAQPSRGIARSAY